MDPRRNPYTPNAGAPPPLLVGRDDQLETFDILLGRLTEGYTEQSMIILGLRGVGKTVLLGEFRQRADQAHWAVVEMEVSKHDDSHFRRTMALKARSALYSLAPAEKWKDRLWHAAQVVKSFAVTVSPDGGLTIGLGNVPPIEGKADTGMLDADLTDLLVALGEAGQERGTGVLFLLDEIHFLTPGQLEALIAALHKTIQRALPVTMVAGGLPQLPELAGEAKSYSERLFKFPHIDRLSDRDARAALLSPAEENGASYEEAALDCIVDYTEGYPYFLQEYGKAVWDTAAGPVITRTEAEESLRVVEQKLDSSFFRVRIDRTTELEKAYLRAMAQLGSAPQAAADVAALLDRTSQQVGPTRKRLIDKGLLWTPSYGYAAFTVPQFDRYLKRTMALDVPPKRLRIPR